jgi:hypothetical protein
MMAVGSLEKSGTTLPEEQRHIPKDREYSSECLVLYLACVLTILGLNSAKLHKLISWPLMVTNLVKNIFLEICALLGYYAAYSSNCFTDVLRQQSGTIFKGQEIQVEVFSSLSRNL